MCLLFPSEHPVITAGILDRFRVFRFFLPFGMGLKFLLTLAENWTVGVELFLRVHPDCLET